MGLLHLVPREGKDVLRASDTCWVSSHILHSNYRRYPKYLDGQACEKKCRPQGYKTFFMLNSTEHEISLGHQNKNTINLNCFHAQLS